MSIWDVKPTTTQKCTKQRTRLFSVLVTRYFDMWMPFADYFLIKYVWYFHFFLFYSVLLQFYSILFFIYYELDIRGFICWFLKLHELIIFLYRAITVMSRSGLVAEWFSTLVPNYCNTDSATMGSRLDMRNFSHVL